MVTLASSSQRRRRWYARRVQELKGGVKWEFFVGLRWKRWCGARRDVSYTVDKEDQRQVRGIQKRGGLLFDEK